MCIGISAFTFSVALEVLIIWQFRKGLVFFDGETGHAPGIDNMDVEMMNWMEWMQLGAEEIRLRF
jgi:hypothetical protein